MTYEQFITNILMSRGRHNCCDGYVERHHIIPRCLGGTNTDDNLIDLYAREHFIAHKLLAKENPNNIGLQRAVWIMCITQQDGRRQEIHTAEEYEEIRVAYSRAQSKAITGTRQSEETKEKKRQQMLGANNPMSKAVYCLQLGKSFVNAYEAERQTGVAQQNISKCCTHKVKHAGRDKDTNLPLTWLFWDEYITLDDNDIEQLLQDTIGHDNTKKPVYCVELDKLFDSCWEAYKETGVDSSGISACCLGKKYKAGSHPITNEPLHWMYYEDYIKNGCCDIKFGKTSARPVFCIELNKMFPNIHQTQRELNITNITRCCLNPRRSAGKHPITGEKLHWVYYDEYLAQQTKLGEDI